MTAQERIVELALTFPSLRRWALTEVRPWEANRFDAWAAESALSHGEKVSARFVLAVWDPKAEWRSGRFNLMEALRIWDPEHRAAYLAWASDPWWA